MRRLIEKGLMFGNLVRVDSPVLVERYNRALEHLTGKRTEQTEFHIDISGYSPEVGHELGDDSYLNQNGVNRQFILLSTEQRTAPLLNARFSTSRDILRQFIEANERALFALTARDAVAGELVIAIYRAESAARLFDIRQVRVEADTAAGTVATARELEGRIERFRTEEDAWFDDVLIAEMIELAGRTGDLTRNPVALKEMTFETPDFWTSHFGGLYVFRKVAHPFVVSMGPKEALGPLPVETVIGRDEPTKLARVLAANGLVETIVEARGVDSAAILHQKMDFIVADVAASSGHDLQGATRRDLRAMGRQYAPLLPPEWRGLSQLAAWAEAGGEWPLIDSEHPAFFYTLRAKPGPDMELVNMLLAELTPLDIRQLFICHKELFYRTYAGWSEQKRAFVADVLANEYMVDKSGTRRALFGEEAPMEPTEPAPRPPVRDRIAEVGPWGALRGR